MERMIFMELHKAYEEVKRRLDTVDFSSLWRGFAPLKFALYNGSECFFDGKYIEKATEFYANTSIEYNGERIAIWNLSGGTRDLDALASLIAHEMFHGFQHIQGESRWADEMEALFDYKYAVENISTKLREAELMEDILARGRVSAFPELLGLRKRRSELFPKEYGYEARIEQIEGSATFVEVGVLARLDPEKGARRWERILTEIRDPGAYTPVRVISYRTGAAFLECIRRCSSFDWCAFGPVPFAEAVLREAEPAEQLPPPDPEAEKTIAAFSEETNRIVREALDKNDAVLRGEYPLSSLNVWDARWDGRHAISNSFLAYYDGTEEKVLDGDFVVELGRDRIVRTVYRQ